MQLEEVDYDDLSGFRVKLREMEISKTAAFAVDAKDVKTVRAAISHFHGETNLRFKTLKNGKGIYVWRMADAEVETIEASNS